MTAAQRAAGVATLVLLLAPAAASAAPGDLDASFGGDGIVQARPGGSTASALEALALSGDRVLAAGWESSGNGCNDATLVRWLADGTPDPAYGSNGIAVAPTVACSPDSGHVVRPLALAVAPDGRAVTGGFAAGQGIGDGEILTAHTTAGGRDAAFGGGSGFVRYQDYFHGQVNDVVRLADGHVAAAGTHHGLRGTWAVSRYRADGTRDGSLDGDGFARYAALTGGQDVASAAVSDGPGGELVVAGWSSDPDGERAPTIGRIRHDGSLDPAFGNGGRARVPLPEGDGTATDVVKTADGGFLTAGSYGTGPGEAPLGWLLLKFDASGRLDETFGAMGRADGPAGGGARAIAVDGAERIVVAGSTPTGAFTVARYLPNGAPDDSFGDGGVVTLGLATSAAEGGGANDVVVQPDGRIVVGGTALAGGGNAFAAARLLGGGGGDGSAGGDDGGSSSEGEIGTAPETGAVESGPLANRQGAPRRVTIRILGSRVTSRGVLVRITYPRGTQGTARARLWTRNKGVLLGRRRVVVLKGTTSRRFRVPLNRRAKRMLRGGKRLKVRATVRVSGLPAR